MRDCLQLQAVKTPYCHWSSRFPLLLNYVQELFLCSIRLPIPSWAHPHSRRENKQLLVAAASQRGSSPLTRGKHRRVETARAPRGLIPAHAGKTATFRSFGLGIWAHPRSRGENNTSATPHQLPCGSSPLTRRKPVARPSRPALMRLIPAHAGKTHGRIRISSRWAAHPRSRGENDAIQSKYADASGSSPLTRGKPPDKVGGGVGDGLIPAHAGKTHGGRSGPRHAPAHPRSRGENSAATCTHVWM